MDHSYIEEHTIADRYLKQALLPQERSAFEAHLVDCPECTDRVLLAEMFLVRKETVRPVEPPAPRFLLEQPPARSGARLWLMVLLVAIVAVLVVVIAIPGTGLLAELKKWKW